MRLSVDKIATYAIIVVLVTLFGIKVAKSQEYTVEIERIQPGEIPVPQEYVEGIPIPLQDRCSAKADVTAFTYIHRHQLQENQMLMFLERDWRKIWSQNSNFTHATYLDMQRIVRDAYRKDKKGKYQVECCDNEEEIDYARNELLRCLTFLHF